MKLNLESKNFRLFSPDENNSNRWQDVLEVTTRCYMAEIYPEDDKLSPDGRVMEVLSEHQLLKSSDLRVFIGGPVSLDGLQILHRVPQLIGGGVPRQVISGGEEDLANLVLRLAISQLIAERMPKRRAA